jgi:hypothetical protein
MSLFRMPMTFMGAHLGVREGVFTSLSLGLITLTCQKIFPSGARRTVDPTDRLASPGMPESKPQPHKGNHIRLRNQLRASPVRFD